MSNTPKKGKQQPQNAPAQQPKANPPAAPKPVTPAKPAQCPDKGCCGH